MYSLDIFDINYDGNKIKLDQNLTDFTEEEISLTDTESADVKICVNEWHQEYELIYRSYVLER